MVKYIVSNASTLQIDYRYSERKNPKNLKKKKFHFILTKNTGTGLFFFLSCFHFRIFDDNEIHIYYW